MRLYVDSNVIIGYIKRDFGGLTQAQIIRTEEFFELCSKQKHVLILSDLAIKEIKEHAYHSQEEIEDIFKKFGIPHELINTTKETKQNAQGIIFVHYPDNLHVQLALDSAADAIVTWNLKDFKKAEKLIRCVPPSEVS